MAKLNVDFLREQTPDQWKDLGIPNCKVLKGQKLRINLGKSPNGRYK